MVPQLRTAFFVAALMVAASVSAVVLKPTEMLADRGPKMDMEAVIPKQFGDWRVDPTLIPVLPAPDVQAKLDDLYDQTIARTYINSAGQRVMLSIAYGGDQRSDSTQVHRPEFCYTAQGFNVVRPMSGKVATHLGELTVRRLVAVLGKRNEPITYWITIGDRVTLPGFGRKLTQIAFGVTGKVPDGMLVRVSSIDRDEPAAFETHARFINELTQVVPATYRAKFFGALGS